MRKQLQLLAALLIAVPSFLSAQYTVTFQLDMNDYTGSFTTPEVNGTFNNWCGATCNPMSDPDGDNIWEAVVTNLPAGNIEFKYAVDDWADQESLLSGDPCTITVGAFVNRILNITGDVVMPPVCWGSCASCASGPSNGNVTFQVDLSTYSGPAYTEVNLNGTFNNWCGSCAVMTDPDGDMIYEIDVTLPLDTIEYKFTLDGWNVDESLTAGDPCTVTDGGFTNRQHIVTADEVLPAVCWESCQTCGGAPSTADVTFQVDMSTYTGPAYTEVNLNGTFNGWCGSCAVMTDPDGDMIYELTVAVPVDTIEYKFTLDGWNNDETLTAGDPCTITDGQFTNRMHIVTMDETLPAYCWESCNTCTSIGLEDNQLNNGLSLFPNPGSDQLNISTELTPGQAGSIQVMDIHGRIILQQDVRGGDGAIKLNVQSWSEGVYVVRLVSQEKESTLRWIKE
jgi:1,4-alpha-glucan branching enzyme